VGVAATVRGVPPGLSPPVPALIATIAAEPGAGPSALWGPEGRARLDGIVRTLCDAARAHETEVWLRPNVDSLVSDLPTILRLTRRHAEDSLRVFLEPTALLAPSMGPGVGDFLQRCAEAVLPLPSIAGVLLSNAGGAPVHRGMVGRRPLAAFARAAADLGRPIALLDEEVGVQRAWLGLD